SSRWLRRTARWPLIGAVLIHRGLRFAPSPRTPSHLPEQQGPLHFLDGLGDLDAPGTGVGAVEGGPATPDPLLVVQHGEALGGPLVAGVEDEAVGVDDRRRADVPLVGR